MPICKTHDVTSDKEQKQVSSKGSNSVKKEDGYKVLDGKF